MQSQLEQESAPMTSLLAGIVHDAQDLLQQQLTLFQVEIKHDARRTIKASIPMIAGALIGFVGVILLAIMAAELIVWAWPHLPGWSGYAMVGGTLAIMGAGFVVVGLSRFQSFNPMPEQAVEGLKENFQWKMKP